MNYVIARLVVLVVLAACCTQCSARDKVALIIGTPLYNSAGVAERVQRYKADVEALFPVDLLICSEAAFESYTPQQIRAYITQLHSSESIDGVILVGQIQPRLWKNYAPGSNDQGVNSFYYEDLDGTFTDTNDDNFDDYHNWGTHIGPEVWVCWMRPPAEDPVNSLKALLDKAHRYYFGEIAVNHKAFVAAHRDYDNNIWSGFSMVPRLRALYATVDIDGDGADTVVASEYLSTLSAGCYEICEPMGHASASLQQWDSGYVFASSVRSMTGGAVMTFIYGCDSASFNENPSSITQAYVFGAHIGQAASGTSWSYGTEGKWYIYEAMAEGAYLGAGWWNMELTKNTPAYMTSRYGTWLDTNQHLWGDTLIGNPFVYANFVPVQPSTLAAVKDLPDGKPAIITDGIVTANFGDAVYIERDDRACGIQVQCASGVALGYRVRATGILGTVNGERVLRFGQVTEPVADDEIEPLMMISRSLSGRPASPGADNLSLLVTVCGNVTAKGTGWCTIDDGSGLVDSAGNAGVRIRCDSLNPPHSGMLAATGISTTELVGATVYPVVRVRGAGDLVD